MIEDAMLMVGRALWGAIALVAILFLAACVVCALVLANAALHDHDWEEEP